MSLKEYGFKTDTRRAIITVTFDYNGKEDVNINIAGYGEKELPMVLQGVFYKLAEHIAKFIKRLTKKQTTMNETLTPHEIQIAIFSQLLTCETLLKPEYTMSIDRRFPGTFLVYILRSDKGRPSTLFCWKLEPANISTSADVEDHIRLFWEDVPNRYKKQKGQNND